MRRRTLLLSLLAVPLAAHAETLRCVSVNGNLTCAGDGAHACQTVNGRTTCTSGGGGVVQSFGGRPAAPTPRAPLPPDEPDEKDEADADDPPPPLWRAPQRPAHPPATLPRRQPPRE
jgi:hypothetical protein